MQTIKACESGYAAFMELTTGAGHKEKLLPLMVPMYQEMAQDVKKSFMDFHTDAKPIEFLLPNYEVTQLLSH